MKKIKIICLFVFSLIVFSSCSKSEDAETTPTDPATDPAVTGTIPVLTTTTSFTSQFSSSPKSGGTITSDGGQPVTARGIVWSLTANPTLANSKTVDGTGIGIFVSTMTNLAVSTKYYVKAYATNAKGTAYGNERTITTVNFNIDNTPALMTANFAGTQYDFMQPYLYSSIGNDVSTSFAGGVNDIRFLKIQGGNTDSVDIRKEINLYIPQTKWLVGTYPLSTNSNVESGNYCQVLLILGAGAGTSGQVTSGTLTITEFNLTTKRVKGTFSFNYNKYVNGTNTGIFQVTNGTFNYGLDSSYFN